MIRILKDFATACYITNPNSHPALSEDQIADPSFEGYCHCRLYYKEK